MIYNFSNLNIFYNTIGKNLKDKTPLLFLHGWGMDNTAFKYFYERLPNSECIVVDFPPFGNSSTPNKPLKLNDYAQIIINLLKYLKIRKVDIVAHSFGGRVAIELASKTNLVNKLLLTGSAGIKNKSFKKYLKVKKYKFLKLLCKLKLYPQKKLNNFGSDDYKQLNPLMKQTFNNIVNYNQKSLLKKINVPTLLIWGSLDKETPFYFTKIFKKNIKDCEVVMFENCGHFAYLEKPQLFLNILNSFFN